MRIVIDIDGTISETKKHGQTYENVKILPGAAEKIQALKSAGHYIILQTARHMKTMGGDVAKVIEKVGKVTEDWLQANNIPYDEIHFGKPYNQIIIDDRSMWFQGWDNIEPEDFNNQKVNVVVYVQEAHKFDAEALKKSLSELESKFILKFILLCKSGEIDEKNTRELGDNTLVLAAKKENLLENFLLAEEYINNMQQLVIVGKNHNFSAPWLKALEESNLYGMPLVQEIKDEPRLPDGQGLRIKDKISNFVVNDQWGYLESVTKDMQKSSLALIGVNYFRCGRDFVSCAKSILKNSSEKEVSYCYSELARRGQQVKALTVSGK